jgi:hypothetical protein
MSIVTLKMASGEELVGVRVDDLRRCADASSFIKMKNLHILVPTNDGNFMFLPYVFTRPVAEEMLIARRHIVTFGDTDPTTANHFRSHIGENVIQFHKPKLIV